MTLLEVAGRTLTTKHKNHTKLLRVFRWDALFRIDLCVLCVLL